MASGSLARRHSPRTAPQRGALLFLPALQFALLWPSVAGQLLDEAAAAAAATAAAGATEGVDQASAAGVTHEFGVAMADGAGSEYEAAGIRSGVRWNDTQGELIQAHGGGILLHEGVYYWFGENKAGPTYQPDERYPARVDVIGVSCYASRDLLRWENRGVVLPFSPDVASDLHPSKVLERPKVIYHEGTRQFVIALYDVARIGVAVAAAPDGPYEYRGSFRPHDTESRDFTLFKDDDGAAYLVYSSENNMVTHISELNSTYTGVMPGFQRVFINLQREAPAVFKHEGLYFILTSGCSGWWPNAAEVHVAGSMAGPWHSLGNPSRSSNATERDTTFQSQGSFVLPVPGRPGRFVFMADRWNEHHLGHSRYVWLPMNVTAPPADSPHVQNAPLEERMKWAGVSIQWSDTWLPY
eukprot:jgi/Tetstr1/458804/TSEL_045188.t1